MEAYSNHARKVSVFEACCFAGEEITEANCSPVLYERRDADMLHDRRTFDAWFSRHFKGLSHLQKSALKNKYLQALSTDAAEQIIYSRAFDISEHYLSNWQGSGQKAQLVVESNADALKYQHDFEVIGLVHSEIILGSTATGDAEVPVETSSNNSASSYWKEKMKLYPTAADYNNRVLNRFRHGVLPEILIVVDDFQRAFSEPRNRVTYLACNVNPDALTAAICKTHIHNHIDASHRGKYRMVIDYADNELTTVLPGPVHGKQEHVAAQSMAGDVFNVMQEVGSLPLYHNQLCSVFEVAGKWIDKEVCSTILADSFARKEFCSRLEKYASTLKLALSVKEFVMKTSEKKLAEYRKHLSWFNQLYTALIMQHGASSDGQSGHVHEERAGYYALPASKADAVVHVLMNLISDMYGGNSIDTAQYKKMAHQLVNDFKAGRITAIEYINKVSEIRDRAINQVNEAIPECLYNNPLALACYQQVKPIFALSGLHESATAKCASEAALALTNIIRQNWKVRFWDDIDVHNRVMNLIDDYLYDEVNAKSEIALTAEQMDLIIRIVFQQARLHIQQ